MKASKSTSRADAPNDRQASAASAPAALHSMPEGREREAATPSVDVQVRHERIAVTAYLLAEGRGFAPGCELDDWLRAEAEVDAGLQQAPRRPAGTTKGADPGR